jgi:hypothetical protein
MQEEAVGADISTSSLYLNCSVILSFPHPPTWGYNVEDATTAANRFSNNASNDVTPHLEVKNDI